MSNDAVAIKSRTEFFCVAKFDGEHIKPPGTGDDVRDRLDTLQNNLTDPQCTELIVGGDGRPTTVWRKVNGSN